MLRPVSATMVSLGLLGCAATSPTPAYETKGPIEAKYQAKGPWAVTRTVSTAACDRNNNLCDIWYPTDLGTNFLTGARSGFRHPAISWANGSGQQPEVYAAYLEHLASWGFIVIAARNDSARNGATTEDAARHLIGQGENPSSVFFRKVDASHFGAVGHSQGGAAITNLHVRGSLLFRTYIGFHTAPGFFAKWCCEVEPSSYEGTRVTAPIFQWSSRPDSGRPDWYEPVPETALKAYALLAFTRHADISGTPACRSAGCAQGGHAYLGYSTAWLMWQLQGAEDGHAAFREAGEFFRPNDSWAMNLSNVP